MSIHPTPPGENAQFIILHRDGSHMPTAYTPLLNVNNLKSYEEDIAAGFKDQGTYLVCLIVRVYEVPVNPAVAQVYPQEG